jgi:DNA replication protein DnaC
VHYVLGSPGVGKTHLSVALAEEAIRSGLGAYFITAHDLTADLAELDHLRAIFAISAIIFVVMSCVSIAEF